MRQFEIATKEVDGKRVPAFNNVKFPVYKTAYAAGCDLFCAEDTVIPAHGLGRVHTGLKMCMEENDVLLLYNRSSNPSKRGLVLANGVGVVDADYYGNPDNDGEIMMEFYNITDKDVVINAGDTIGQAVLTNFIHPASGYTIVNKKRTGGFGSTDKE